MATLSNVALEADLKDALKGAVDNFIAANPKGQAEE